MEPKRTSIGPIIGLLAAMILWGSSFVALKLAFQVYDPMVVIFFRMFIATLCFVALRRRFRGIPYHRGDWKPLLLLAFFEPCLYFIFEAWALVYTTASQAGMIVSILPLMVAAAAHFLLKEHTSKRTLAGFALAIAGAAWLSVGGQATESAPNPVLGNFLEFVAMIFATGYTIMIKKLSLRYPPLFLTAVQAAAGSVFFFPLMFLPWAELPRTFDPMAATAIVYLGVVVTLGAYTLYNYGVSRIPASQASSFVNLIPVFTIIMGWLILNERFTAYQWAASAMVFTGVFLSQDRRRGPSAESA